MLVITEGATRKRRSCREWTASWYRRLVIKNIHSRTLGETGSARQRRAQGSNLNKQLTPVGFLPLESDDADYLRKPKEHHSGNANVVDMWNGLETFTGHYHSFFKTVKDVLLKLLVKLQIKCLLNHHLCHVMLYCCQRIKEFLQSITDVSVMFVNCFCLEHMEVEW